MCDATSSSKKLFLVENYSPPAIPLPISISNYSQFFFIFFVLIFRSESLAVHDTAGVHLLCIIRMKSLSRLAIAISPSLLNSFVSGRRVEVVEKEIKLCNLCFSILPTSSSCSPRFPRDHFSHIFSFAFITTEKESTTKREKVEWKIL